MDDDDDQPPFPDQRKNKYDLNSKMMLTAIVSLSIVVVIVTLLHIYARFVLRRQARRRAAMQQLRLAVTLAHTATEPPKTGLHPSIIASLPIFVFRHSNTDASGGGPTECAVCLSFLEDNEMARILPNCKHTFHAECIDKWLGSQSTCPICRTEAKPRLMPEPREGLAGSRAGAPPSAPPLEHGSLDLTGVEGTSDGGVQIQITTPLMGKINGGGSSSRLSSFRRMLSREKSSRRINHQSGGQEDERQEDVERQ